MENKANCAVWKEYPQSNETVTWSGACVNGKAQGRGTQVWRYLEDGDWKENKYTGDLKDGRFHGRGVYVSASGARYEGDWKDGKRTGRGVYVTATGDRYEGEYRGGKAHGRGAITFVNGDECEGEWRAGRLLGMGNAIKNGQSMKCYLDGYTIKYTD